MTINERFRIAREARGLSQRNVAEKISVGNTAISRIESGTNNPSDRTIRLFCDELGISEKWLRIGEGEMFVATVDDELTTIAQRHGLDEMDVAILRTYINLPKEAQAVFKNFILTMNLNGVQAAAKFNETNAAWSTSNASEDRPAREKSGDVDKSSSQGNNNKSDSWEENAISS